MIKGTLGSVLINAALPEKHRIEGSVTKKNLKTSMLEFARNDPENYARTIPKVKRLGDTFATFEGVSVGLDDIAPQYKERDPIIRKASRDFWGAKSTADKTRVLLGTQNKLLKLTAKHPGDMGLMARSGGRGSHAQLMKAVTSPVVIGDFKGTPIPYMLERGYSEGLSPAEAWIAGDESRGQVIKGQLGTADPGDLGKIMASMMTEQVIAKEWCGTRNGISMPTADSGVIGRYLAGTNTVITPKQFQSLKSRKKSVRVASPMTCELPKGVCQRCTGQAPNGSLHDVGTNVGLISAQALSEPLTQMQLSAKHGVSLVKGEMDKPQGLKAVRQFLEVPKSFFSKATVSEVSGSVDAVNKAPQGGYDIRVGDAQHYVPPGRSILVNQGQSIEAGDVLSSGVPAPNEIVSKKGLGAGRKYLVGAFSDVYGDAGINIDKRHLELLARSQLNHVKVVDKLGPYLPGEIVPYQEAVKHVKGTITQERPQKAVGKILTAPVLHHLPGAQVTPSMAREFSREGLSEVSVTDDIPRLEAVMAPASRTPLLNPNWMQRLGHRYQKATILQAAHRGETADLHSYSPVPAIVVGRELRRGPAGEY